MSKVSAGSPKYKVIEEEMHLFFLNEKKKLLVADLAFINASCIGIIDTVCHTVESCVGRKRRPQRKSR